MISTIGQPILVTFSLKFEPNLLTLGGSVQVHDGMSDIE